MHPAKDKHFETKLVSSTYTREITPSLNTCTKFSKGDFKSGVFETIEKKLESARRVCYRE